MAAIAAAAGPGLLDVHTDADHNRSVLTLVGEEAPRAVSVEAVARLDLRAHEGAHPRFGVVDVVPFVPLGGAQMEDAIRARDGFARWAALDPRPPVLPLRSRPGPPRRCDGARSTSSSPTRARPTTPDRRGRGRGSPDAARRLQPVGRRDRLERAADIARPSPQGLRCGRWHSRSASGVQVSCNLVDPMRFGPAKAYDAVASEARVTRAELVGLVPASVLQSVPAHRWTELDLGADRTIEARLEGQR